MLTASASLEGVLCKDRAAKPLTGIYHKYYQVPPLDCASSYGDFPTSTTACSGLALLLNV